MVISHENHHMFHGKPSQFCGICNKNNPSQLQKKNRWITTRGWVTLWLFNSSPWKIPMLFLERYGPSISIRAIENPWLALWMSCHNQLGYSPGIHQLKQLPSGKQSQKTMENHDVSWVNPLEIYGHNINSQLLVITRG